MQVYACLRNCQPEIRQADFAGSFELSERVQQWIVPVVKYIFERHHSIYNSVMANVVSDYITK